MDEVSHSEHNPNLLHTDYRDNVCLSARMSSTVTHKVSLLLDKTDTEVNTDTV
jgi:hypothetical protein